MEGRSSISWIHISKSSSGSENSPETVPRYEPTATYRTLGVHLSPSGDTSESYSILKTQAEAYASSLIGSHLSSEEAFWSYILFLIPKLCYQLPCLALSKSQYDSLMSIVLTALLPKLPINRNTARSIIHGPIELGGLNIPNLYTYQGLIKVSLFLGHLRLQDKTGTLLQIALSHLQLLSGSRTYVLNLPFSKWGPWLEHAC